MHHHTRGRVTRQAHVDLPEGTVEEEFGRGGFFGRASHLYRSQPPVGWTRIEGELRPRALHVSELGSQADNALSARVPFLHNDDLTLCFARASQADPFLYRNADADELLFVHAGCGSLESDFGNLEYRPGDYLVIPRGTAYRMLPSDVTSLLVLESRDEVALPERGILGHHALFDLDVVEVPEPGPSALAAKDGEWELRVKHRGQITKIFYPFNPLNTVGWKGNLSVWRLNVADIRPVLSERYHLPPSAHATFITPNWVVCTFLPRPLETGDPGALRVPFYHSNIDYDEVIFYHSGEFFSRAGIRAGMLTYHPQGIHHGPQPAAVEAAKHKTRTNEVAVMIDAKQPLEVLPAAAVVEQTDYWKSWSAPVSSP